MNVLKSVLRPAVHLAREVPTHTEMLLQTGQGPRAVFLPAYGRHGAALLRIYNIAEKFRLFGWRTLVMPWKLTLVQRQRLLARADPDILVMQGARHVLNRPELYPGCPIIYDMDDADFHLPHLAEPVEQAMARVDCVVAGSRYIARWCQKKGAQAKVVWTGAPVSGLRPTLQASRGPVVAWAQTAPMTYTREADWVLEVMRRVALQYPDVRLRLYDRQDDRLGADQDAFLKRFKTAGVQVEWHRPCVYRDYLNSFDDVSVGLAPLSDQNLFSLGKAFGKVLAYMDRHVPVVASRVGEYPAFFDETSAVVSNNQDVWVQAITGFLSDADARQRVAQNAYTQFTRRLSVDQAARELHDILEGHL